MIRRKGLKHHLFSNITILVAVCIAIILLPADTDAEEPEPLVIVDHYFQHVGGGEHFMNTDIVVGQEDETGVTSLQWEYGWYDGENVVDTELLADLYIEGTAALGSEVVVQLQVTYPAWSGSTDVTLEFLDNGEVIAETTETLLGQIGGGEEMTDWRLPFNENADGPDHHTIRMGHTLVIRLSSDEPVNIDYQDGEAHLEFFCNQMENEEFFLEDGTGENKVEEEFGSYHLEKTTLSVAHFRGVLLDTFTHRDVQLINIEAAGPQQTFTFNGILPEHRTSDRHIEFHHNWSIFQESLTEADAGQYEVSFEVVDRNDNSFPYDRIFNFTISKYGAWAGLVGEEEEKDGKAGETVTFDLDLHNAGIVTDTFAIDHDSLPSGWTADFDPNGVELISNDTAGILLEVTIPEDAEAGTSVEIITTSTSEGSTDDPEFEKSTWNVVVTVNVQSDSGVSVFFREQDSDDDDSVFMDTRHKEAWVKRGEDHAFIFRIRNTGSLEDEFALSLSGAPDGWDIDVMDPEHEFIISSIILDANDEETLVVRVTAPTDQQYEATSSFGITGISSNDDTISDTAFLDLAITNDPPLAEIVSISPSPAMDDEDVELIGSGQDSDGTIEGYRWTSSIDGTFYQGTSASVSKSDLSIGTHTLSFSVRDDEGAWSDEVTTTLIIHDRPEAEIISITPTPAGFGEDVEFTGSATDADGISWYLWTSSIDGLLSNGTASTFTTNILSSGTHTVTLQVRDTNDGWSFPVEELLVVSEPNIIPEVRIISPVDNTTVKGTVFVTGSMSDVDDIVEFVEISIQTGEWIKLSGGTQWSYEWNTKNVKNGVYVISARAFDGEEYSVVVTTTLTVDNEEDDNDDSFIPGFGAIWVASTLSIALFHRRKR